MLKMNIKRKHLLLPGVKSVLAHFNMNGGLSILKGTTLVLTVKDGPLDIIGIYRKTTDVRYHKRHLVVDHTDIIQQYDGQPRLFLKAVKAAMNNSGTSNKREIADIESNERQDHWLIIIQIGTFKAPYLLLPRGPHTHSS